jgi:hypothetical protein
MSRESALLIRNPKQRRARDTPAAALYPYYAGFQAGFARDVLSSAGLQRGAYILDPWNGSGTTTATAAALGFDAHGFDLNPVMVVVAKAGLVGRQESPCLWPITVDILRKAQEDTIDTGGTDDPLETWLVPKAVHAFRRLERAIQLLLVDPDEYQLLSSRNDFGDLSDIAGFFYTALFRAARRRGLRPRRGQRHASVQRCRQSLVSSSKRSS